MAGRVVRNAMHAACYAEAIAALTNSGPVGVKGLTEVTGLHFNTVRKLVNALHRRRLVYIAEWGQDYIGRFVTPLYAMGNVNDVKKPPRLAPAEIHKRTRAKRKALKMIQLTAGATSENLDP